MILFEILVPCVSNTGKPFRTRQHKEWDRQVRRRTGGLTIMSPSRGQWTSLDGELFSERMIPVRIATNYLTMEKIADMTARFYDQEAVMFYEISRNVCIQHYKDGQRCSNPK